MEFPVPAFTTFTIPTGAGPGTARIVLDGVHGAILVYNNSPIGRGSLVFALADTTFTDPYGNAVQPLENLGNWSVSTGNLLAHMGVDANGNVYIVDGNNVTRVLISNGTAGFGAQVGDPGIVFYNAFGAIILIVDQSRGGVFQYFDNNSAVQGNLIGAQVGKVATDPVLGNTVQAGFNIINPVFGDTCVVVGSHVFLNNLNWNVPAEIQASGGNPSGGIGPGLILNSPTVTGAPGTVNMALFGESANTLVPAGVVISTANPPVRATSALLEITSGGLAVLGGLVADALTVTGTTILDGVAYLKNITAPSASAGFAALFSQNGRASEVSPSGSQWTLQGGQAADTTPHTITNAGLTNITTAWNIPASDAVAGTIYQIEAEGFGTQGTTAQSLQFAFSFGGVTTGTGITFPSTLFTVSQAFRWKARAKATCVVAGAGATWFISLEVLLNGTTVGSAPDESFFQMNPSSTPVSVPSNVAIAAAIQVNWGAITGAPTVTCTDNDFTRRGL